MCCCIDGSCQSPESAQLAYSDSLHAGLKPHRRLWASLLWTFTMQPLISRTVQFLGPWRNLLTPIVFEFACWTVSLLEEPRWMGSVTMHSRYNILVGVICLTDGCVGHVTSHQRSHELMLHTSHHISTTTNSRHMLQTHTKARFVQWLASGPCTFYRQILCLFYSVLTSTSAPGLYGQCCHMYCVVESASRKGRVRNHMESVQEVTINFYRHMYVWSKKYTLPFDTSGTASCGSMIYFEFFHCVFL